MPDPDDIDDDEGGSEGDDEDDLVGDVEDFPRRPTVINIPNWQGGSMRDTRPPSRDTSNLSFSRFTSASYIRVSAAVCCYSNVYRLLWQLYR
jgi:hypothetical protein